MKRRKTWHEKLLENKGLPKTAKIEGKLSKRWGEGTVVIPAPVEVDALMKKVPAGRVVTVNQIREALARKHGTTIACPLTTGIFSWIAAHAAAEAMDQGVANATPYWRTLKSDGELNPKFPGGIDRVRELLCAEGHKIEQRGKRWFVADYECLLARLP